MRLEIHPKLTAGRIREGEFWSGDEHGYNGVFRVFGPTSQLLWIIASDDTEDPVITKGWEHVSVTVRNQSRCPNWPEMCFVKSLFWDPEETVVQFHPPESQYVSNHPYCLHLWRNRHVEFPLPPPIMVGVKAEGEFRSKAHADRVRRKYMKG